ncbi:MAG: N-acetylneuraminate synthase [Candidatus Omnitrophica bacterium]|nr:N-acetylneuraminate synthase [Candidatus Omnitrophota bacterium]
MPAKVFIIAEAGVNHNGSLALAKKMIDEAALAGIDAVKFQTYNTEDFICRKAPLAGYQRIASLAGNQYEMLQSLRLDEKAHKELFAYCRRKKVIFLSSAFDLGSLEFLFRLGLKIFKIPSGELTNLVYLRKAGSFKKPLIVSSGMAYLAEVRDALRILVKAGARKKDITVMHCNTEYPTPMKDVNLKAMLTIKQKLKVEVGYSDHTLGIEASLAAVALGAKVIEKHFTLDKDMAGPDHKASLEPDELFAMVESVRNIEKAMGDGIKKPSLSERKNIRVSRKSIVASSFIRKGQAFCLGNLAVKRPGSGVSPMRWDEVIGRIAKKDFHIDEPVTL